MSQPNPQNLSDNIERFKNKIKKHEDNLKFLNSQANTLAESILDAQVSLGRQYSGHLTKTENGNGTFHSEEETVEQILKEENSAAGIYCLWRANTLTTPQNFSFTKDVVGVVATLAKVDNDDLSRLLSEYLGLETMLAIVCKNYEAVKELEKYDMEGTINCNDGLYGLGSSIGRKINGQFTVINLEDLSPFVGGLVADDPQNKLALPKPKLPNGECPPGFLDYAVNVIHLDSDNLSCVMASGYGLRETLFYHLFSRLQIYRTRKEMLLALPCINDGALSLDGGMIKKCGMFMLGSRKEVEVKFPVMLGESDIPADYNQAEYVIRMLKWESSKLTADIQREQQLLDHAKASFNSQA